MIFRLLIIGITLIHILRLENVVRCQDSGNFFLKAAKSVPRIGRSNGKAPNVDFEKFFLKASKSVPRIGRRGQVYTNKDYSAKTQYLPYPYSYADHLSDDQGISYKLPVWSEIAERYEYDPELLTSPELLAYLEQAQGDDPSVYDWEKVRIKRTSNSANAMKNKEIPEYRFQPVP